MIGCCGYLPEVCFAWSLSVSGPTCPETWLWPSSALSPPLHMIEPDRNITNNGDISEREERRNGGASIRIMITNIHKNNSHNFYWANLSITLCAFFCLNQSHWTMHMFEHPLEHSDSLPVWWTSQRGDRWSQRTWPWESWSPWSGSQRWGSRQDNGQTPTGDPWCGTASGPCLPCSSSWQPPGASRPTGPLCSSHGCLPEINVYAR